MIIKIHDSKYVPGGNKGSVASLKDYLEKEDLERDFFEKEGFFNQHRDRIPGTTVENMIDKNHGKLGKNDTKFFMLTVNPSKDEMLHLNKNPEALKSYVNDLMHEYAKNFGRTYANGKPLEGKDLMYFAKIEHQRTYKHGDRKFAEAMQHNKKIRLEIIKNLDNENKKKELEKLYIRNTNGTPILEGNLKDGNNTHVHIIVSRYDSRQKFKLSPLTTKKGTTITGGKEVIRGFNRSEFVLKGEQLFDKKFNYKRGIQQSYEFRLNQGILLNATNPKAMAKIMVKRALLEAIQDKTLQKAAGIATSDPKRLPKQLMAKVEKEALKAVMNALDKGAHTNPVSAGVNIAKKTITIAAKAISKAASI